MSLSGLGRVTSGPARKRVMGASPISEWTLRLYSYSTQAYEAEVPSGVARTSMRERWRSNGLIAVVPVAVLVSAAGGAAHISRNSFSSIWRASRSAAHTAARRPCS